MFERQETDVEFDAGTFVAMVEKVSIGRTEDGRKRMLSFELRNGQLQRIEL